MPSLTRWKRRALILAGLLSTLAISAALVRPIRSAEARGPSQVPPTPNAYLGSASCARCHDETDLSRVIRNEPGDARLRPAQ